MSDKIRYVVQRFPDLAQAIKQCCADNRFFSSLCEDYGEAVEVLRSLDGDGSTEALNRLAACRELVEDLEREILEDLEHRLGG